METQSPVHFQPIVLRPGVEWTGQSGVNVYLPESAINSSDQKEFASNDRFEERVRGLNFHRMIFDDILFKSDFIRTFREVMDRIDVKAGQRVLELGAAHGWASVLVKSDHPDAYVVASELVPQCMAHSADFEKALSTDLDEKWSFSVRDIPFASGQFDRIFTFASFHHFGQQGDYAQSLAEIARILKPGGKLVLLYEPASPALLYPFAYRRVNRNRRHEGVDEDVLVVSRLAPLARTLNMSLEATPFPFYRYRSSVTSSVYYFLLSRLRLGRFLTCTANITMRKLT